MVSATIPKSVVGDVMKNLNHLGLAMLLALAPATSSAEPQRVNQQHAEADLSAWSGRWRSVDDMLADPGLRPAFELIAERRPDYTAAEARRHLLTVRTDDYGALEIAGNRIRFLDADLRTVLCSARYANAGDYTAQRAGAPAFRRARMIEGQGKCRRYRYLLLGAPHGRPAGWHLRYGSEGFAALEKDAGPWWPGVVGDGTTLENLEARLRANLSSVAAALPPRRPD